MSNPFGYLRKSPDGVDGSGSVRPDYGHVTAPSTTASDEGEGVLTPSTSTATRTLAWLDDDSHAAYTSELAGVQSPAPPEPTVLLVEIRKAAEDVTQLVERFGTKMARTLASPITKTALFPDANQLRLPSLRYADSFTCRFTEFYKQPVSLHGEAPLLWWLWDAMLKFLDRQSRSNGFTLAFTPARNTDMALPYTTISITLSGSRKIEMTAVYGGVFDERRIFSTAIAEFHPFEAGFEEEGFEEATPAALAMDETPYRGAGCYRDALDYLMPRPDNIWRGAMAVAAKTERRLVSDLAGTCRAEDDGGFMVVTKEQDLQCKNLLRRLPPKAREFIKNQGLVGKEGGRFSRMQNQSPDPRD